MNDFMARWVLTAGILCLLPDEGEVIVGMEEMGGVRYYFLCHLNGSHAIQFLKTAIRCRASNNLAGDGM